MVFSLLSLKKTVHFIVAAPKINYEVKECQDTKRAAELLQELKSNRQQVLAELVERTRLSEFKKSALVLEVQTEKYGIIYFAGDNAKGPPPGSYTAAELFLLIDLTPDEISCLNTAKQMTNGALQRIS